MLERWSRHRFAWLFCTLMLAIGAAPALRAIAPGLNVLEVLLGATLLATIATVGHELRMGSMLAIGGVFVGLRGVQAVFGVPAMLPLAQGVWLLGMILGAVACARYALRGGDVDADRIFAALDAYLLAGLMFGVVYWLLGRFDPTAFNVLSISLARATYFSFVTIGTLGYGDIVPTHEVAQGLAVVEVIGGQMYLAVLIARLVSLYSTQARR